MCGCLLYCYILKEEMRAQAELHRVYEENEGNRSKLFENFRLRKNFTLFTLGGVFLLNLSLEEALNVPAKCWYPKNATQANLVSQVIHYNCYMLPPCVEPET